MKKLKLPPAQIIEEAQKEVAKYFEKIDKIRDCNQEKVLRAFQKNKIGEEHFYTVTGYGHDDMGREALDNVFADVFKAQKAIVRPHFVSGTHTLACVLFGILRYQDTLMSVAGKPYDTLDEIIGHSREGEYPQCSLKGHGVDYIEVPLIDDTLVDFGAHYSSKTQRNRRKIR